LLCHCCVNCCVLHVPKSFFLHDLQRPNACSSRRPRLSIDAPNRQCIESHLNRLFCIFERIVTVTGGEICVEHQQTSLERASTHLTTNTLPYIGCAKDLHFHEKREPRRRPLCAMQVRVGWVWVRRALRLCKSRSNKILEVSYNLAGCHKSTPV
jgi:hypothetical protein